METPNLYDLFAALLEYPGEDYPERVARCAEELRASRSDAAALVEQFAGRIGGVSTEGLQALFTSTFDLDPDCTLEVGWHLFGEQYERGEFLVRMRRELRRHGLAESTELPDHLTHVLALLGRVELQEADAFAAACVFPALDKMRAGWEGKDNPFENVLEAIAHWLESWHARPLAENLPAAPVLRVLDA